MYVLMTLVVLGVGLAWGTIFSISGKIVAQEKTPGWTGLVDELKKIAPTFENQEHLEHYLSGVNEQVKNYETDYSFLVAFNTTIREIREKLNC